MKFSPIITVLISVMVVVIIAVVVVSLNNNEGFGNNNNNDFCNDTKDPAGCKTSLVKVNCGPSVPDDVTPQGDSLSCGDMRQGYKNFSKSIIQYKGNM